MPVGFERGDRLPHPRNVLVVCGTRHLLGRFEAEGRGVFAEGFDVAPGVFTQRHPRLLRLGNRTVVHVGEIHDVAHAESRFGLERAPQHVADDEGAEIADVAARVHGQPTAVHPDGVVP